MTAHGSPHRKQRVAWFERTPKLILCVCQMQIEVVIFSILTCQIGFDEHLGNYENLGTPLGGKTLEKTHFSSAGQRTHPGAAVLGFVVLHLNHHLRSSVGSTCGSTGAQPGPPRIRFPRRASGLCSCLDHALFTWHQPVGQANDISCSGRLGCFRCRVFPFYLLVEIYHYSL